MSATAQQIRAIHSLKHKAGLDEDEAYRDFLERLTGSRSSKSLSQASAGAVIERLKVLAGQNAAAAHPATGRLAARRIVLPGALNLSGPYAGICRALWISGWHLGVFESREDTALAVFVRRQTGIDSLNWVRDHEAGRKVVDGLKAWLKREAGVAWPGRGTPDEMKAAVFAAQLRLLGEPAQAPEGDLDGAIARLGERIRARKAKPERNPEPKAVR